MTHRLFAFAAPVAACLCFALPAGASERPLTTFDGTDTLRWETVNDDVMGGRSQGGWERT